MVYVDDVKVTPNPVETGKTFTIYMLWEGEPSSITPFGFIAY